MVDQILKGTGAKIKTTLTAEGVAADATGTVKVTIVRDSDGSTVVNNQDATDETGTGIYSYTLTPAQTAELDLLRATWTATIGGVAGQTFRTSHEIVGGFISSLDALAALPAVVALNPDPTTDKLNEARTWAECWLEDECSVAFRPRYRRETLDGSGRLVVKVNRPRVTKIRACSIDDSALSAGEIAGIRIKPAGVLYRDNGWSSLRPANLSVAYEYGWESAPAPVIRAALKLAADYLVPNAYSYDERATSITTDEASYALVTPGMRGAVHSIPEVNIVVEQYGYRSVG